MRAGQVDTPPALARRALAVLRATRSWQGAEGARTILDPSCGVGALLAAAQEVTGSLIGFESDPERIAAARRFLGPDAQLWSGDALGLPWPGPSWVLANPPWLSHSGRQARPRSSSQAPPAGHGWPALHAAFLVRIAEHVARHGTAAVVLLPKAVSDHPSYAPTRAAVEGAGARVLGSPQDLGEDEFPGVRLPAQLLTLEAGAAPSRWSSRPAWLDHLKAFPSPPAKAFGDPGVHTGNSARLLVGSQSGDGRAPLRQGRDLQPFFLGPPSLQLDTRLERTPERRFRYRPLESYQAIPILLRQTADRPMAALHEPAGYFRNTLLAGYGWPEIDPAALVALLNGPVARAAHRARFSEGRQRTFPQVKVGHLQALPLPWLRRDEDPEGHDELARRVRALAAARGGNPAERAQLERLALDAYRLPAHVQSWIEEEAREHAAK